jgi:hypothetical protein
MLKVFETLGSNQQDSEGKAGLTICIITYESDTQGKGMQTYFSIPHDVSQAFMMTSTDK